MDIHAADCGDRVIGVALRPDDHEALSLAELWGLPVLAWPEMRKATLRLLCEANGVLIPEVHTFDDVLDEWMYHLQRPADDGPLAA
jgi:hypothetical protein